MSVSKVVLFDFREGVCLTCDANEERLSDQVYGMGKILYNLVFNKELVDPQDLSLSQNEFDLELVVLLNSVLC